MAGDGSGIDDVPAGRQQEIGGRIDGDGVDGSLRGLCLDGANDRRVSHVATLGRGGTLGWHDDGLLVTRRLLFGGRLASLLRATSVLRHMRRGLWRMRDHGATMAGGFASHQRSAEHADDRDCHQQRNELANAHHAIARTIMNVEWTNHGDIGHR